MEGRTKVSKDWKGKNNEKTKKRLDLSGAINVEPDNILDCVPWMGSDVIDSFNLPDGYDIAPKCSDEIGDGDQWLPVIIMPKSEIEAVYDEDKNLHKLKSHLYSVYNASECLKKIDAHVDGCKCSKCK